jgi:threonine/homoserine/homoserine lactone efflux protein
VHPFVHGLVTQGANPKLLAFFAAIVPQFIDPARSLFPQLAILGVSSIVIEWFVLAAYGTLADGSGHLLRRPRFATAVNRIGGTLLIGAGLGLAGLRRSA